MSYLVSRSFFVGEINIPNSDEQATGEKIDMFIALKESECLTKVLGYSLYKLLQTEHSQRMTDLLYGKEYTNIHCELTMWEGLLVELIPNTSISPDPDNSYWTSLIADYIYFFFEENSASITTGMNTTISKSEFGTAVSPEEKMRSAWNSFSKKCEGLFEFLNYSNNLLSPVYPEFTRRDYYKAKLSTGRINIFGI